MLSLEPTKTASESSRFHSRGGKRGLWKYDSPTSHWESLEEHHPASLYLPVNEDDAWEVIITSIPENDEGVLQGIEKALNSSKKSILSLKDDWDEAGSPSYSEETWERMANFLIKHSTKLTGMDKAPPIPQILPGPNGSIDLLWKSDEYELLVNIPPGKSPANFYGDDKGALCVKGKLDPEQISEGILQWLMNRHKAS